MEVSGNNFFYAALFNISGPMFILGPHLEVVLCTSVLIPEVWTASAGTEAGIKVYCNQ